MAQKTKNIYSLALHKGFPGDSAVRNAPANARDAGNPWVQSLGQQDPLEGEMYPTPVFLPGKFLWTEESGKL